MGTNRFIGGGIGTSIVVFVIALLLAWLLFFPLRLQLATHTFGTGLDAAKNIYTPYYHLAHDSSYWHFEGMNYPFGENIVYTDNQPAITNILKAANAFLPIEGNFIWIFNWILILSIPVAALVLFTLLRKFHLPNWYAGFASLAVVFLSPQLIKFTGHYALAHMWVFPMVILLCYLFIQRPGWPPAVLNAFLILFSGFIHPYLLLISAATALAIYLFDFLFEKIFADHFNRGKTALAIGQCVGPVLIFFLVMKIMDPVSDRPADPYGFLLYRAPFFSMVLPVEFPWFKSLEVRFEHEFMGEETAYLGAFAVLGSLGLFLNVLVAPKRWARSVEGSFQHRFIYLCFFAGLLTMMAAQAIPFVYDPSGRFLEFLGPLRQFRGLGRFAMASFYLINIAAVVFVGMKLLRQHWRLTRWLFMLLLLALSAEALMWSLHVQEKLNAHAYPLMGGNQVDFRKKDFQAIISLPYTHVGSENFRTSENITANARAFQVSAQTGLPMLNVVMSRTSYSQTQENLQLMGHLSEKPRILNRMGTKPFLIIADSTAFEKEFEKQIIAHAELLKDENGIQYYQLPVQAFTDILSANRSTAARNAMEAVTVKREVVSRTMVYHSFDERGGAPFHGSGGLATVRNHATVLFKGSLPPGKYELSFWFLTSEQQTVNTQFAHSGKSRDGDVLRYTLHEVADLRVSLLGEWMLAAYSFEQSAEESDIEIFLYREGPRVPLLIDEVLLRPVDMDVKTVSDTLNLNNRYYP